MSNSHRSDERDALLNRALVPKGYRPARSVDIERMLDAIGDQPISDEKLQRMLRKINGQEPVFPDRSTPPSILDSSLSPKEQEEFALCRSKNKPLPPDLAAKVKALEERAASRDRKTDGEKLGG